MLVEDTVLTYDNYLFKDCWDEAEEHRVKKFHSLVLQGYLLTALWLIMDMNKSGVMKPGNA